ncbi:hypothetical protein GF1_12980 [Desulfolithobacter dissulfuricans]|uniref:Uncharacterized protein n=1 Tax=Desulfolithobacter dissulfuricans TaxID=2795293 RepID=A0A915XJP7_9BACT|nr:hypothetical protein [Desulfolithobacter dissulfuricans]BCO08922.1 hypothetical protein GF1_12980 [Desulfolithobacter dissulfuricans]
MDDDNLFDEDDALDRIMYEEHAAEGQEKPGGPGCFAGVVIVAVQAVGAVYGVLQVVL